MTGVGSGGAEKWMQGREAVIGVPGGEPLLEDRGGEIGQNGVWRDIQAVSGTRQTREREIVRWVGRIGAVELGHLQRRWRLGRSVGYALVARLVEAGLLERVATLPGDPTLLRTAQHGLDYAGLGLAPARIAPGQVDHWLACADVALWAEGRWGEDSVRSERELRFAELEAGKPIGSATVGELPNGRALLHRPDLLIAHDRSRIALEVELSPKAPRRLEHLVRSWCRARDLERVLYVVPPGPTKRAVLRARERAHAEEHVEVLDLAGLSPRFWGGR